MKVRKLLIFLLLTATLLAPSGRLAAEPAVGSAAEPLALSDGDRLVLLGDAFVERMQAHGYLESLITAAHPDRRISIRNLGWSGDTVSGIARAVFGSPADGFARLEQDVRAARPTVILVAYGGNEAFGGPAGLDDFRAELNRLLDMLATTEARIVLLSPHRRLVPEPPLPDPADYNEHLRLYCDALQAAAKARDLAYVDLYDLLDPRPDASGGPLAEPSAERLTDNGVHLSPLGAWYVAPLLARRLGADLPSWQVELKAGGEKVSATGARLSGLEKIDGGLRFRVRDEALSYPPAPRSEASSGSDAIISHPLAPAGRLAVRGLPAGRFRLRIDGQEVTVADDAEWQAGVALPGRGDVGQFQALRKAIGRKNELFFHRYRPQNETYLFLFRKHEQGNNAAEIPQFDPLIAAAESRIAELARPPQRLWELRRVDP